MLFFLSEGRNYKEQSRQNRTVAVVSSRFVGKCYNDAHTWPTLRCAPLKTMSFNRSQIVRRRRNHLSRDARNNNFKGVTTYLWERRCAF